MYIYMCNIYVTYKSHGSSFMKCTLSPLLSWLGFVALFVSSHSILKRIKKKIVVFQLYFGAMETTFRNGKLKIIHTSMNFLRAKASFVIFASTCIFRRV